MLPACKRKNHVGGKRAMGGEGKRGMEGLKVGRGLALSKGPARMGISCRVQRVDILSKGMRSYNEFMQAMNV
jgi:hypothetical protein